LRRRCELAITSIIGEDNNDDHRRKEKSALIHKKYCRYFGWQIVVAVRVVPGGELDQHSERFNCNSNGRQTHGHAASERSAVKSGKDTGR